MTGTFIRARGVCAVSVFPAGVYSKFTFVYVDTMVSPVTMVTFACIGTNDVNTVRIRWAGIITRCTFVNVYKTKRKQKAHYSTFGQLTVFSVLNIT